MHETRPTYHRVPPIRPELLRYLMGGLLSFVSIGAWVYAGSTDNSAPGLILFLAVFPLGIGYAALFGWRIAVPVLITSAILGWYLILPPELSFEISDPHHSWYLAGTVVATVIVSILVGGDRDRPKR